MTDVRRRGGPRPRDLRAARRATSPNRRHPRVLSPLSDLARRRRWHRPGLLSRRRCRSRLETRSPAWTTSPTSWVGACPATAGSPEVAGARGASRARGTRLPTPRPRSMRRRGRRSRRSASGPGTRRPIRPPSRSSRSAATRADPAELRPRSPGRCPGSWPWPTRRAASARPPRPSTWAPAWPTSATGSWSSTSIPRATPAPAWASTSGTCRRSMYDVHPARPPDRGLRRGHRRSRTSSCAPATSTSPAPRSSWCRRSAGSCACKRALEDVRDDYDFVLIDCPPVAGAADGQRLGRRHRGAGPDPVRVLRPGGPRPAPAQRGPRPEEPQPDLEVCAIVLVMYDARTKLADQVVSEVREHFGDKVVPQRGPPHRAAVRGARRSGSRSSRSIRAPAGPSPTASWPRR